jgi:hypothetical protein
MPPSCIPVGSYTTKAFLEGQLTVTFDVPWQSAEDQAAEFSGAPPGTSDIHRLLFWMDILPTDANGKVVAGVPHTADGLLTWLAHRANIDAGAVQDSTIGAAELPAHVIDIAVAPDAKNEDPAGCPTTACIQFLTWPDAGTNVYGIGTPNVVRLSVADVSYGGRKHLFAIAIEARDRAELDAFSSTAQKVIASMTGPITPD